MKPTKPWKKGLNLKLGLGVAALLILGLGLIFGIVNTIVRGLVYDNVSGIVLRSKIAHAAEIDEFFGSVAKMVRGLAISLGTLPSEEHFAAIAESFVAEYDFIENVTIGFSDGRVISAVGWLASDGWGFANRPWYAAAAAAGAGVFVVTEPFVSSPLGGIAIAKATWAPGIGGVGGAVSASVPMYHVFELVAGREVMANGYLILVGPDGKILAHPDVEYSPAIYGADSVWTLNIRSIPNGDFLMDSISAGQTVTEFQDHRLGRSYLITIPLEITGWTLAAVIPVAATREPMFQFLALVMVALAIVLLGLFILSAIFFSRLTKNMEESSLAEQRLRLIFDHLPFASTFRDRKRNLLNCNAETVRLFGVKDTQEYMHRSPELSPEFQPDGSVSREKAGELIEEAFENGGASFDWMHQTLDGEPIPTEVTLIRIEQSSGAYLLSFIKDMREHYEAQRKERLVMQRMQTLLDTSPLVCLVLDEHCNVLEANREVERLFEIPDRKTFMGSFFDFSPARQPDGALSRDKMIAEIGKALESEKSRCEWTHQTLKGKHIPCEAIFESVKIDGRNLVMTYVRDLRDFHKYRKTERVAQQRLQAMLDSSPLACSIFDENFNVQEVNHELLALFDVADRRSYIGRFSEFSPRYQPDGRSSGEKFREKVKVALDMGRIHFEWMHQTLRGSPIPCEVTIVRVYLDDKPLLICYTRDCAKSTKPSLWSSTSRSWPSPTRSLARAIGAISPKPRSGSCIRAWTTTATSLS